MSVAWDNFLKVSDNISKAAIACGRNPADIRLVAVSKKVPVEIIRDFLDSAETSVILAENYVQDFVAKIKSLPRNFESHLIGPLQSNKVKSAVENFDLIQSVHSSRIINLISTQSQKINKTQRIFLQVNISADPAKQGFRPAEIESEFAAFQALSNIKIEGLMTITMNYDEPEQARPDFIALRNLRDRLDSKLKLSMGMSADYPIAIAEGADYVRIGTAIFGER